MREHVHTSSAVYVHAEMMEERKSGAVLKLMVPMRLMASYYDGRVLQVRDHVIIICRSSLPTRRNVQRQLEVAPKHSDFLPLCSTLRAHSFMVASQRINPGIYLTHQLL